MDRLKNMIPPKDNSGVHILLYDKWNAAIRCDKLNIQFIVLGGVLRVYEHERGISMRKATCHQKSLVRIFDPLHNKWLSGCFSSFSDIEKKMEQILDVQIINIPLSDLKEKNIAGLINHLTGNTSEKSIISIWSNIGTSPNLIHLF
nr:MAG: wsv134-like protein [Metapenaeopsis lamellata majanivirus]